MTKIEGIIFILLGLIGVLNLLHIDVNILMIVTLVVVLLHIYITRWRWQMLPAYVVCFGYLMTHYTGFETHIVMKYIGYFVAFILIILSMFLTHNMPILKLGKPRGKYGVGVVLANWVRVDGDEKRPLFSQIYYPAADVSDAKRVGMWSEFYQRDGFPKVMKYLMHYLQNIVSHSYLDAPLASADTPYPVLIYNHALISIAAENSLLLQELASHGYIVLSVRHDMQEAEYRQSQQGLSDEEKANDKRLLAILEKPDIDRQTRAETMLEFLKNARGMAGIVARRAADSLWLVEKLDDLLSGVTPKGMWAADLDKIGAIGLSTGGAVATELAKLDERVKAVVNLDGGIFCADPLAEIKATYMMIYSELNLGSADFLKPVTRGEFNERVFLGAKHMNFHDVAVLMPLVKYLGMTGKIDGKKLLTEVEETVVEFFAKQM